jgi:hypothetical protein
MSIGIGFGRVFTGEGITYLGDSQYLVEREDGQLEFIDPLIEIYKMRDTITTMTDTLKISGRGKKVEQYSNVVNVMLN